MTIQEILSGLAATNTNYAVELKEAGFPQPAKLADMIIMGPAKINYREILKEMMRQRSDFTRDKCVDILKKLLNIHSSRKVVQSATISVDTDDLSEICIDDFFEPQGLDSVISILPVSDVTEDACLLIQDQLNRNGDFSNINVPEEVLAQAQVIFDSADYDSVTVSLSSENYLIFKLDNPSVKVEEDSDVKLVAPEDTVVIETDDGDFLVKSKDSNFVEFIDEEMGDGTGDDEEMTEIVDGVNSSVKLVECDGEFIKNAGYKYCLVKSSKGPLLKNLMNNLDERDHSDEGN